MPQIRMKGGSRHSPTSRMNAPPHPFPELQGPFEESMTELERLEDHEVPSDAASRRTILLDAPTYERVIAGRWKQRPGEKYHPLWKIVAQLSFGIHLLAENLAKSEEEVMQILQGHIDEIDLFLERTTEDFALAHEDIQERMRCLQLPLQHPKVFDRMLEDRAFRTSIVEGNEKIEHIVARTGYAMKDSLKDAQKGLDATSALEQYLTSLEHSWGRRNPDHEAVYEAMLENVEGWRGAFVDLHAQGKGLGQSLKQLTEVINQMQQRAGEVSRRLIRAQQKQGHSPASSNNITYVSRQSTPSGRRSQTSERPPKRKPLPDVPEQEAARHSTSQSQRSATAQSTWSATSQRSGDVRGSRASSREGTYYSARDSAQTRLSTKSPRLVEIKRHSPHAREASQTASLVQDEVQRPGRSASQSNELPAELPGATRRVGSISPRNAGLGIIQNEGQVQLTKTQQSPAYESTSASKLPPTPSSIDSNGNTSRSIAYELASEPVPRHVPAPLAASSQPSAESALGSPPSTPRWAKQTFDIAERQRMVTDKTAFRSHPPTADLGSPPVIFPSKFNAQVQHGRLHGSTASSLGAPGPEVALSERTNSVKSGSVDGSSIVGLSTEVTQSSLATITIPRTTDDNQKAFVAELEGTTPLLLQPAVFTRDSSRKLLREVINEVVELEAPQETDKTPPIMHKESWLHPLTPSTNELHEGQPGRQDNATPVSSSVISLAAADAIEHKVAAAVRRSFIATNIELPGTSLGDVQTDSTEGAIVRANSQVLPSPAQTSSKGIDDMLAELDLLNTTSPNLTLKAEEMLITLPATTYKAEREQPPISTVSPANREPSTTVTSPDSSAGSWSNLGTPRSRPERMKRNSSDSTTSSQSQWRAFFKGQLSPAEFSSSTPHLPSKLSSTHKAIIELQRRGQEASPTLGWQWAPETPDVERRNIKRTIS